MDDIHIVSVTTENAYYFPYLQETCKKNGATLTCIGDYEKWKSTEWRLQYMIHYAERIPPTDIVCFVDGFDVICIRPIGELCDKFAQLQKTHDCKIIVAYENAIGSCEQWLRFFCNKQCQNTYLNTGTMIGYARDIRYVCKILVKMMMDETMDLDQLFTKYGNTNPQDIYIDSGAELFLCLRSPLSEIDEFLYIDEQQTVHFGDKKPFFIHASGCTLLTNLLHKLGYEVKDHVANDIYLKYVGHWLCCSNYSVYCFYLFCIALMYVSFAVTAQKID